MTVYKTIKVGKPIKVEDLKRKPLPRARRENPRDAELEKLVNQVSVGSPSEVIPWVHEAKAATARLAASRAIKRLGAKVYVSSRPDYPGMLLFSRVPLSGRQGDKKVKSRGTSTSVEA